MTEQSVYDEELLKVCAINHDLTKDDMRFMESRIKKHRERKSQVRIRVRIRRSKLSHNWYAISQIGEDWMPKTYVDHTLTSLYAKALFRCCKCGSTVEGTIAMDKKGMLERDVFCSYNYRTLKGNRHCEIESLDGIPISNQKHYWDKE